MRLGAPLFSDSSSPEAWIAGLRHLGYGAAYCPLDHTASDDTVKAYADAAARAGIVIAEVGAWSNPLGPDEAQRRKAVTFCKDQLALAERIGARCCVNIAGSRGEPWDGPDPRNLTRETFEQIVETVRGIIDEVRPRRTYYTLETMPWMYPDSPDSYLDLVRAIDRDRLAVHLDPANLICSPQRYFANAELIKECFAKLGPRIRSCHGKDIALSTRMTVHLDEVRPGLGALNYRTYLSELDKLDPDAALMLEHLPTADEYDAAAAHVRSVAEEAGLAFR